MTRKTKVLSGASQEAYFRRVLKTVSGLPEDARETLVARLRADIAQIRVRPTARIEVVPEPAADPVDASPIALEAAPSGAEADVPGFDPFALNVIVTLRTQGREAALGALNAIANAEHLKLLAREQRLSIDDALSSSLDLSTAIVTAAERRLANRRAAASAR